MKDTPDTETASARRYFVAMLWLFTGLSVAGNITHAVIVGGDHMWVRIAVAAVPPLALLTTTHGIAKAVRAGVRGTLYWMTVVAVGVIAVGAFAVSFAALQQLAVMLGYDWWLAAILPLVVDATVAVSTAMLVALDPPTTATADQVETATDPVVAVEQPPLVYPALDPETRWSAATTTDIPVVADSRHEVAVAVAEEQPTTATTEIPLVVDHHQEVVVDPQPPVVDDQPTTADQPPAPLHLVAATASGDHQAAATAIAARGVVKVDATTIAEVLAALADGRSQRATAELAGVDRSVVAKIKSTAATLAAA